MPTTDFHSEASTAAAVGRMAYATREAFVKTRSALAEARNHSTFPFYWVGLDWLMSAIVLLCRMIIWYADRMKSA